MNKTVLCVILLLSLSIITEAQTKYDSITLSRCMIKENWFGNNWPDSLKTGSFAKYVYAHSKVSPQQMIVVTSLINRIKANGTADISKCFIPRHSINFYKNGKIASYLLICFECDGVRFSTGTNSGRVISTAARERQMGELRKLFGPLAK